MAGSRVYGHSQTQRDLFARVTAAARTLREQLHVLNRLAHLEPHDGRDVERVRAALFRAAGW